LNGPYNTLEVGISNLAFGINYGNGTAFNQTLINNTKSLRAILALDFRGLGLNNNSYLAFSSMLQLAANNAFDCAIQTPDNNAFAFQSYGSCLAPQSCSAFPNLWNYSFNVTFADSTNYLTVPLATFAQSFTNSAG
jgi:hypothetical protein